MIVNFSKQPRKKKIFIGLITGLVVLVTTALIVWAATSTNTVGSSSTSIALAGMTQRHLVRTSDGTLHSFYQAGSQVSTCGGVSKSGLLWFYSTDSGANWTCGDQLSTNTTYYASAQVDSSDNIYLVYSVAANGGATTYGNYYRKLTKGAGSTWTLESEQTIAAGTSTIGYGYSVIEVEGTTRLWMATRYYDGSNYQVTVYYSNDLSAAPTWTISQQSISIPGNNAGAHYPSFVRFGTKIGLIYQAQFPNTFIKWRIRDDSDDVTTWSPENIVTTTFGNSAKFSAVSDSDGNVYFVVINSATVVFNYWNGRVWSQNGNVSTTALSNGYASLSTDGTNVWVFYQETTGLISTLSGNSKLVYKKGWLPYSTFDFDINPTAVVDYHGVLDKYWRYVASGGTYTNDTTDAGNVTVADTVLPGAINDISYFGKTQQFDSLSWVLSTNGVGGVIAWEYWNGSSWASLTLTVNVAGSLTATSGYVAFNAPTDWATTTVNGEGTPYYYIRARASTGFSTPPVASQIVAIPNINFNDFLDVPVSNAAYGIWTENAASPVKVRGMSVGVTTGTPNTGGVTELDPKTLGFSTYSLATQPSSMNSIVRTSEGTIHSFINGQYAAVCGSATTNNSLALNWVYSTDSGANWTCGGQIFVDTSTAALLLYASATTDASDNVYVVYSTIAAGGNGLYNVHYRKLTKGVGSTWTVGADQTIVSGSGTTGYSFAVIAADTTRLWMAARYFDGVNYVIKVYYSGDFSAAPSWSVSTAAFDLANNGAQHVPAIVRYKTSIGIIYASQATSLYNNISGQMGIRWRFRNDSDSLTSWSNDSLVDGSTTLSSGALTAVTDGNIIYIAYNASTSVYLNYWDGYSWQPAMNIASGVAKPDNFVSLVTDGSQVWVIYREITGYSTGQIGDNNLVYKRCVIGGGGCSASSRFVSQYNTLDKYWSYVSSSYLDDTTDAASVTAADTRVLTGVGDVAYFGKLAKFDTLEWQLSTIGIGGQVRWEYWNGSAWAELTEFYGVTNSVFTTGQGYISFSAPTNWATTNINGEGTPYYYIRARAITAYSTPPVVTQFVALSQINWGQFLPNPVAGNIYGFWAENSSAPVRIRFGALAVDALTVTSATNAEIDPAVVGYSATANAIYPSTLRRMTRTSDGTLHAFVQAYNKLACGGQTGNNNVGLMWIYSTDDGANWTCGGQLHSDLTNLMYASVTKDDNDNLYVVYSPINDGSNNGWSTYYRKLTKGVGATWTIEAQQTALSAASGLVAYTYSTIMAQGTTRLWLATRYFDGTNYQVVTYYSDGLSTSPTWTVSQTMSVPSSVTGRFYPLFVRFGTKIGVLYNAQYATAAQTRWRWRNDSDGLTAWSGEATVGSGESIASPTFEAVGDTAGRVYYASNNGASTYFSYWNGVTWSQVTTVNSAAGSPTAFVDLVTDGSSAWVIYPDPLGFTGMAAATQGYHRLVYKKGVAPFTPTEFDVTPTPIIPYHNVFDKYWSYVSSSYLDDTTDAGNVTASDTRLVTGVGDIAYFGKLEKFDGVTWETPTAGVGGQVVWEYWNGSAWAGITSMQSIFNNGNFTAVRGYITFTPPTNWATTTVNGEGTPYYYVRARVIQLYTTPPVATQLDNIPRTYMAAYLSNTVNNKLYGMWSESIGVAPMKVRFAKTDVTTETLNSTTYTELKPTITSSTIYAGGLGATPNATRYSTQRQFVQTSDGTIHGFIQATTAGPCGNSNGLNNTVGLVWVYSTDSGQTWTCGGQVSDNLSVLMYGSATVDANDNLYLTYSPDAAGASSFYGVFYRKFTKGAGSTWTMEAEQTVVAGGPTAGYSFSTIEAQDTTRLWLAVRYYDNNNYQVATYYSDGLSAAPTWTLSQQALNTPGNSSGYHIPAIVRFGTKIGVIYDSQAPETNMRWRWRDDADGLTTWNSEIRVSTSNLGAATFSAAGDTLGNVYLAMSVGVNLRFTYWNGSAWSATATIDSTSCSTCWVSLSMIGTTAYVYYGDTDNLLATLPGSRKFVYRKGNSPYAASDFDASATSVVPWHGLFTKFWKYTASGSTYTDLTTAAGDVTLADVAMPSAVGDIAYFGMNQKFDAVSWVNSTNGTGGKIHWEYWNGSAWVSMLGYLGSLTPSFTNTGYITFIPPDDWATTAVNAEGSSYYYVRARVETVFSVAPVASQLVAIPPISWGSSIENTADVIAVWTEGGPAANRVRFVASYFNVAPSTPSNLGPASLVGGGATADNTPALTFSATDPNVGDTIQYQIQIDDTANFSSPVVDYTSASVVPGDKTFTVGQAAGSGTYTTGSEGQTLTDGSYYWRIKTIDQALLESSFTTANGGAVAFSVDTTIPASNAANPLMLRSAGGLAVSSNGWINGTAPYFSWDAGADNVGGSGIAGYCLYLGTDAAGNPATSKGLLGTSPVSTAGTTCQFIVGTTSIDLSTLAYQGGTWLTTSTSPYYLNIKAIDAVGNIFASSMAQYQFRFDNTVPTNVTYVSPAGGNFSNVADMSFFWPTSGSNVSSDAHSGILGWQYQINATDGTWKGATTSAALGINYIPNTVSLYQLTNAQDGSSIVAGNNNIYFRTVDQAGNFSSDSTIRTGVILYGGSAPTFGGSDAVTVNPTTSITNSYDLAWPAATPASGSAVTHYYYMINTTPPTTLDTLQNNPSTYIDSGTSRTVAAGALSNVNRGSNTVYVVAIDGASPANYSSLNYISGSFTLNSTNPDNVGNLVVSDSSIKSQSLWNATLTWTAPDYQGAGNLTYLVYRSTDDITYSQVGSSTGLSYVDNVTSSSLFYYKVYARDGAQSLSSGTNAVSITPTGRWTSAPTLDSGPTVSGITTNKATIAWTTNRTADSKIQYGTATGSYKSVEPSNSTQVTGHSLSLTGLTPGTTYYYRAKWTDEDGNTTTSSEKTFVTAPPPTVKDVQTSSVGLSSAIISFTTTGASSVKIYYGTTTAFGLSKTISTATTENTYSTELTGLTDGTKYYFKINTFDSDNSEYDNQVNDFSTLPRPKISGVKIQQVVNTAQTTILVTWNTNTEVSSIVSYYPEGDPGAVRDEVNVSMIKGQHKMIVGGLLPQTSYMLVVRGRDKIGNEAVSDSQKVNTSIDTRPPTISELRVEGSNVPPVTTSGQEVTSQLVVSWNTDEPSTSQVEFGEGSGSTYAQKTQQDDALTFNHLVIISNLTPAKVYHLRTISQDKAKNLANSLDTVTITPKATDNALYLVVSNLQQAFGFLGNIKQ